MPTKTIVLSTPPVVPAAPPKPIEFTHVLNRESGNNRVTAILPSSFKYIELVARDYLPDPSPDLMFAYDDPERRGRGSLFLGYWNDGVV